MSTTTKPFDYRAFIERIRNLLDQPAFTAKPNVPLDGKNPGFIEWKQKVVYAITQIEALGYKIHCGIQSRSFTPRLMGRVTEAERRRRTAEYFQRALHETTVELKTIVEHFDSHGTPPLPGQKGVNLPKVFDYAAFIAELRVLRDSFATPPANHRTHDSQSFKQWKHELTDLMTRIEAQGYSINCGIRGRQSRIISLGSMSSRENAAEFDRDHIATMIELDTIISRYETYGDPKGPTTTKDESSNQQKAALDPKTVFNEKLTWPVVRDHMPLSWWWALFAGGSVLLGAAFTVGKWVGEHSMAPSQTSQVAPTPTASKPTNQPASAASK